MKVQFVYFFLTSLLWFHVLIPGARCGESSSVRTTNVSPLPGRVQIANCYTCSTSTDASDLNERLACYTNNHTALKNYKGNMTAKWIDPTKPASPCTAGYCEIALSNPAKLANNYKRTGVLPSLDTVVLERSCPLATAKKADGYGCRMDGSFYVCNCDWEVCNGDLALPHMFAGILDSSINPFDFTEAMMDLRARLQNITLSPGDYKKRLDDAISSAGYAAETHSAWVEAQERKANGSFSGSSPNGTASREAHTNRYLIPALMFYYLLKHFSYTVSAVQKGVPFLDNVSRLSVFRILY